MSSFGSHDSSSARPASFSLGAEVYPEVCAPIIAATMLDECKC